MAEAALVQERYAIETRAQMLRLVSADAAVRRGESDRFEVGRATSSDAVDGAESLGIGGDLVERLRSRAVDAMRLETRLHGGLAMRSGTDMTLLGGAMAETHAGPVLVAAGMSDELIIGGGIRVAGGDLRLAGLLGGEERIGTAQADAALVEAYATHFEREYGNGHHVAGFARFSGAVLATAASGFRPLFKVASGVRNLAAGAGGGIEAGEAVAGDPLPAAAPPRPPSTAQGSAGLLATARSPAPPAGTVAGLSDSAFDAERLGDLSRYLGRADAAADAQSASTGGVAVGRSSATAESLTELRRLTQADVDESLARLRLRAHLPDDAGMGEVVEFLHRAQRGQIGDLEMQRATLGLHEDIAAATRPFLQPLVERGIGDDLDALTLAELRGVFARELRRVRALDDADLIDDVDVVVDLQAAFVGFDQVVFRSAWTFLERFDDLAASENMVPAALAGARLPHRAVPVGLPPGVAAPLLARLLELRLDWADQPSKTALLELAIDEVRHGNDPMPIVDNHVRGVIWRSGEVMTPRELDALQEAVSTIRLTLDDALDRHAADAADLAALDESDAAAPASTAPTWRNFAAADGSTAPASLDRVPDANVRGLTDLTLDDDARVANGAAAPASRVHDRATPRHGIEIELVLPPSGNYPFVPPRLPTDVNARELSRLLRGYRATLTDPTTGLPPAGSAARDVFVRAKRRAVTDALDALRRGQDPVAVLDEQIAAARRRANPPAWVIAPNGMPLIDGEIELLQDVRRHVDDLLRQQRGSALPGNVGAVNGTRQFSGPWQHVGTLPRPGSAGRGGPPPQTRLDYVLRPAMQPTGLRADIHVDVHDYEDIASLAAANIRRGDLDAAGDTYATVSHLGRPDRLGDAGTQPGGVPAWTIFDDDPHRIVGFADDRRGRRPLLRVTRAEKEAIDNGDIVVRIINMRSFNAYDDFETITDCANGALCGRQGFAQPASAGLRHQRVGGRPMFFSASTDGVAGDGRDGASCAGCPLASPRGYW